MAENLLAQLLSPTLARAAEQQRMEGRIMDVAGSRNPLLAEAGRTANLMRGSLGGLFGTDLRSPVEQITAQAQEIMNNPNLDEEQKIQAMKQLDPGLGMAYEQQVLSTAKARADLEPEPTQMNTANFVDQDKNEMFRGVELPNGQVLNLNTREIVPNAVKGGTASVQREDDGGIKVEVASDKQIRNVIEGNNAFADSVRLLSSRPTDFFGSEVLISLGLADPTTPDKVKGEAVISEVTRRAQEIQRNSKESMRIDEAVRLALEETISGSGSEGGPKFVFKDGKWVSVP